LLNVTWRIQRVANNKPSMLSYNSLNSLYFYFDVIQVVCCGEATPEEYV